MADNEPTTNSDDTLSLEDLVRDTTAPPVAESVAEIDKVLEVEDPGFAAELQELKEAGAKPEVEAAIDTDVEHLVAQEKVEKAQRGWRKVRFWILVKPWRKFLGLIESLKAVGPWLKLTAFPASKAGAIKAFDAIKTALSFVVGKLKAASHWFGSLAGKSKLLVVGVVLLAGAALVMTRIAIHGSFLPSLEKDFVYSLAEGADQKYEFEPSEKWQNLNDPLLHPEHIVLVERLIVNLKPTTQNENPMALLDLYIEGGSQDATVEIKDRNAEIRDLVLRTMEQMTYEDLSTEAGKAKLKTFLRKSLNDILTKGRVRRIFFKSIVLKQ